MKISLCVWRGDRERRQLSEISDKSPTYRLENVGRNLQVHEINNACIPSERGDTALKGYIRIENLMFLSYILSPEAVA